VTDPLRLSFEVACPARHAFEAWTAQIGRWWPVSHSVSAAPGLRVVLEARVGGRIFERTPEGVEHEWGEVVAWDPPHGLTYLWHLRRDRADATEVEIRFVEAGDRTRVEIEHRGWDRLGALGPDWRETNRNGWAGLLPHFVEFAAASPAILDE
jgi:hypothetical protein